MEPVRWGILSTAKIGRVQVIPAMQNGRLCRIDAIASRNLDAARKLAADLGIPKAYGSYEELLADPEIEAVYNPLPNTLHVEWTRKAAEAGKHVLCEKPIALSAAEAETLVAVRERTGVRIEEAFMVRHHPQWLRMREIVRSGTIGDLRAVQGFFSYMNVDASNIRNMPAMGGGSIFDIGCYPVVVSRFLFGAEPNRVVALGERDPVFGTDRLASVIMDFPSGQAGFVCSTQLNPFQRIQVVGTTGRVEVELPFNAMNSEPTRLLIDLGGARDGSSIHVESQPAVDQYTLQGDAFSEGVRSGRPPEFPIEDAVRNMRVLDAIFRSMESGGWETVW